MSDHADQAVCRRVGILLAAGERRGDCCEWRVEVEGQECLALAFDWLTPHLERGRTVLLNTTAAELALGTGGLHFILGPTEQSGRSFEGREAGHLLKLRYTPLQHRRLFAEEEISPWREAIEATESLDGTPILAAELHSQAAAALVAVRQTLPDARTALVWLDSASLPAGLSRTVAALKQDGVLNSVITCGQAFGGDFEAVNVYSALLAAKAAVQAEVVVVSQGPGNVGTGTRYGFGGMAVVEALHSAAALGGRAILAPRISGSEARLRHMGLSRHTLTQLRALHVPVEVPYRAGSRVLVEAAMHTHPQHRWEPVADPPSESFELLKGLESMGRTVREDPVFFTAAWCAGVYAADAARSLRES
jgi:hypothetical protein